MKFDCACSEDGRERCGTHAGWGCHAIDPEFFRVDIVDGVRSLHPVEAEPIVEEGKVTGYLVAGSGGQRGECPPCWLARIRSVSLSSKATPTRRGGA